MCNCGRKKNETMVWQATCAGEDPRTFLTELEAKAFISVCKAGKGAYTRTRKTKANA